MKQLQNNFTTVEQSKRLLELGLPSWTADCCFDTNANPFVRIGHDTTYYGNISPCWSVGRLIEICNICNHTDFRFEFELWRKNQNDYMIEQIIYLVKNNCLDFSKLGNKI